MSKTTHAEQLVRAIRRRQHTYGDLLALQVSTAPWKRFRRKSDGLVVFRIVRG